MVKEARVSKGEMGKKIIHGCVEHGILIRDKMIAVLPTSVGDEEINTNAKRIFSSCGWSEKPTSMKSPAKLSLITVITLLLKRREAHVKI